MVAKKKAEAVAKGPDKDEPQTKIADPSVYKKELVVDESAVVTEPVRLDINVLVWEIQNEQTIARRRTMMEQQEHQVRAAMEQLAANGGKQSEDYGKLITQHNELVRQLAHLAKTVHPGSVVQMGQVKGQTEVTAGMPWAECINRHVLINPEGKVEKVLWKPPTT